MEWPEFQRNRFFFSVCVCVCVCRTGERRTNEILVSRADVLVQFAFAPRSRGMRAIDT